MVAGDALRAVTERLFPARGTGRPLLTARVVAQEASSAVLHFPLVPRFPT